MKRLFLLLTFAVLCCAIVLHAQPARKRLTVDLVAKQNALISPGIKDVSWSTDGKSITYVRSESAGAASAPSLWIYDIATRKARILLEAAGENQKFEPSSYAWSPRGDALLLKGDNDLWLLDVRSGEKKRLTHDSEEEEYPAFSPQGGHIGFVKQNNLYALDIRTDKLKQLTFDGSKDVLNGKLDWVYEEELAYRAPGRAFVWSPDGSKIAYLRLDDTAVPQYPLTDFLTLHAGLSLQRFPQPGDPNPVPSFHVVSIDDGKTWNWNPGQSAPSVEYIAPLFRWTQDSQAISFLTLNRDQNELTVHLWNQESGNDRTLLVEKDPYWINSLVPPIFIDAGKRFLWLSERDGWLHLYLYDREGKLLKQLTRGAWQIEMPAFGKVPSLGIDEQGGWVYFEANKIDPRQRQIYRIHLDGTDLQQITKEKGCHSLNLSPQGGYVIDTFSTYQQPPQQRLLSADGTYMATLDRPQNHLDEYALGKTEFVTVKARDGAPLYARLTKPPNFNPQKKYPVVVYVYGGPHVQMVKDEWTSSRLLDDLFAQEGFLVWTLDNRGSSGRGHAWESVVFEHLGEHELADQLDGVAYLKSLPYVDENRMGILGWSYGGYMTLYALTHAPGVFKCGAAGGPVTDWKFYDSIYTERYMRTPQANPEGYRRSSPLAAAHELRGRVLLIHGADDDNVHLQNTMNFLSALVKAGLPFELYIQPGQKHGFTGDTVVTYLDQRLLDFFKTNLHP